MNPILDALDRRASFTGRASFDHGCRYKIMYESEKDARRAAKKLHKLHKKAFDAYRCSYCSTPDKSNYHVGGRRKEYDYKPI